MDKNLFLFSFLACAMTASSLTLPRKFYRIKKKDLHCNVFVLPCKIHIMENKLKLLYFFFVLACFFSNACAIISCLGGRCVVVYKFGECIATCVGNFYIILAVARRIIHTNSPNVFIAWIFRLC